jgi:hypothetical protein
VSFLEGAGLVLGIGIAVGMLAGTTGTRGSARGRMTLLAAAIGLIAGLLLAGTSDLSTVLSGIFGLAAATAACVVISDVVSGAQRREGGGGALAFLVSLAALLVVALALLLPVVTLLALLALLWLGVARQRRAKRKHAGLRVLR